MDSDPHLSDRNTTPQISTAPPQIPVRRALLSVSDKTGLADFARGLARLGVQLYSTGGTRKFLQSAGFAVIDVGEYTGFPEMLDGRVKTLHPKIHGGILCRHDRPDDMQALERAGIVTFELVVVNLYPFEATVARPEVSDGEAIENIDIGGPSLIRGAAKNHRYTTIVTDAGQYAAVLAEIQAGGGTSLALRRRLAGAAYARTARYDQAIAAYFARTAAGEDAVGSEEASKGADPLPRRFPLELEKIGGLRYGENPHQPAALYVPAGGGAEGRSLAQAKQIHGKELSYNNLLDLDSAWVMARLCPGPAAVVVKHNNPCGAAADADLATAMRRALDGDPVSAFGSVIALNREVDAATAEVLCEPDRFVEAIVAPAFQPAAVEALTTKPKWKANVRLMQIGGEGRDPAEPSEAPLQVRQIDGGYLIQQADFEPSLEQDWKLVTETACPEATWSELRFAWAMVRHVKSNAIVVAKERSLIGVGAGQMSRVDAVEIALRKAGDRCRGAVLASDAFFPFADSIHLAAAAGIGAIIQPGGSRRDEEVIAACNQHKIAMLFTGRRHFKH